MERTEKLTAKALKNTKNDRYLLAITIAKRAEQLAMGVEPLVVADKTKMKLTDIALIEIAEGKVILDEIEEA